MESNPCCEVKPVSPKKTGREILRTLSWNMFLKGSFVVLGLLSWWAIYHNLARFADWVTFSLLHLSRTSNLEQAV